MSNHSERSWLHRIEIIGNKLPDPVLLFIFGSLIIVICAEIAVWSGWQVEKALPNVSSEWIQARSLFSPEGIWWWLSSLVKNFIEFPPLGIVLVGMLGQ